MRPEEVPSEARPPRKTAKVQVTEPPPGKSNAVESGPNGLDREGLPERASISAWTSERLPAEVTVALQRLSRTDHAVHIAVMPDVHLANRVCNGTVLATQDWVYPEAVGSDIGCGMAAIRFDCAAELLDDPCASGSVLRRLIHGIPAVKHGLGTLPAGLPEELSEIELSAGSLRQQAARDGLWQFGTLGRGNHFVELQRDQESGELWLMVHSGSRGMGEAITELHLHAASTSNTGLLYLDSRLPAGQAYLNDMEWALRYAAASRARIVNVVADVLEHRFRVGPDVDSFVDVHHNFVRREEHFRQDLMVHRKGAISAAVGETGVIPGAMGAASFHVEGRGAEQALRSSSHGAGRRMSRTEARQRITLRSFQRQMGQVIYDVKLANNLRDEAPGAYKNIREVMQAQRQLTRIRRTLLPALVHKAS